MNTRSALASLMSVVLASSLAAAQGVVLREDFESGAPGWTFSDLWHIAPDTGPCAAGIAPFPSPGHAAWYGSAATCDYTTANFAFGGGLRYGGPFNVPASNGSTVLRYRRYLASEFCVLDYDLSAVIVTNTAGSTLLYGSDCAQAQGGWVERRLDLSSLSGQAVQLHFVFVPGDNIANGFRGWWIDDIEIATEPGVVTCTASSACPCANQWNHLLSPALPNEDSGGCKHSSNREAQLFANGTASVAADTVELVVHDLPQSTSIIYVQGLTSQSVTFGDGKRCFGGTAVRLAVRGVTGGQDTYPHAGEPGVALQGSVPAPGGMRTYQVVYRDAASYCTSSTFNTSNGYVIAWVP